VGTFKDLTGQQFGELNVLALSPLKTKNGGLRWLCKCSCGKEKVITGRSLTSGNTKSCGCKNKVLNAESLIGQKFGRLLVTDTFTSKKKRKEEICICICDCGNTCNVRRQDLRRGHTKSCGCLMPELTIKMNTTHNMAHSKLYKVHASMMQRCYNKNNKGYKNYGGRGIYVCKEWENFEGFVEWALSSNYQEGLLIERINNDGPYSPENCKWATSEYQNNNKRSNRIITFDGKTMTWAQWARFIGISRSTLVGRLTILGWSIEKALTTPVQIRTKV